MQMMLVAATLAFLGFVTAIVGIITAPAGIAAAVACRVAGRLWDAFAKQSQKPKSAK